VEHRLRVRYFETDQMQVAHHAHYFVWFEAARSEFCLRHGIDYRMMEAEGTFLPIAEAWCRFRRPARYDDEISVLVAVASAHRRMLRLRYRVVRNGTLLGEGETVQVPMNARGVAVSMPTEIVNRFLTPALPSAQAG
jgi:acyl-CoA thioester hydrolase